MADGRGRSGHGGRGTHRADGADGWTRAKEALTRRSGGRGGGAGKGMDMAVW